MIARRSTRATWDATKAMARKVLAKCRAYAYAHAALLALSRIA